MEYVATRRIILSTLAITVIMVLAYFIASYFISRTTLALNISNVENIVFIDKETNKEVAKANKDDKNVRLKKFKDYTATYTGVEGYANGEIDVYTDEKTKTIDINPYLSRQQLDKLNTDSIKNDVTKKIIEAYPTVLNLYNISDTKLYGLGDYYGVKLAYKGDDYFNTDSLHIALVKEGATWKVSGEPDIVLNIFASSEVPADILEEINLL